MLRAEESTRSKRESDPQEHDTDPASPGAAAAGRLVARCGLEAVNAVERTVCGPGAVREAAVAEGLALAGRRSATLLEDGPGAAGFAAAAAPWVHHRIRPGQPCIEGEAVFELVAGSAQEAVDHCLVAHRMAQRLGLPGVCTVEGDIARDPQLVRLPGPEMIAGLLHGAASASSAGRISPGAVLDAAREAFERVAAATGRPRGALVLHGRENADHVLVSCGVAGRRALEVADALREAGVACGVVNVALVRPFPAEELRGQLGGAPRVAVIEPAADPAERDRFVARVRENTGGERAVAVVRAGEAESNLLAAVARAFDLGQQKEKKADAHLRSAREAAPAALLGAAPAGCWSDQFLLDAAALLGSVDRVGLRCPQPLSRMISTLAVGELPPGAAAPDKLDLLLIADLSLLAVEPGLLEKVRDGGTVVIGARGGAPRDAVLALDRAGRREVAERRIRLKWIDGAAPAAAGASPQAMRTRLLGAFLSADESLARLVRSTDLVGALCASEEVANCGARTAELLQGGAESLQTVESSSEDAVPGREPDFRPPRRLPLMPSAGQAEGAASWREALHEFHLTGRGAWSPADPPPPLPLKPAGLAPLAEFARLRRFYPFVLLSDGSARSLVAVIQETVESILSAGASMEVLRAEGARLARTFSRVLAARGADTPFGELLAESCDLFVGEFDLSDSGRAELQKETQRLREHMPSAAAVIDLDGGTLLRLQAAALGRARGPQRFAFLEDVRTLIVRLDEKLQLDRFHSPEGQSAEALSAAFGEGEAIRIDTGAMSRMLPDYHGSKRLEPARRERVERTVATLRGYLDGAAQEPECVVVHPGLLPAEGPLPAARMVCHPEPLRAAVGLFDGLAERMTEVIRAVRIARLEKDNAYDSEIHDAVLARFDWQAFTESELRLIPPVIAVESGARLRDRSLAAFSALLRSGRPVQVLALEGGAGLPAADTWEQMSGYHPGLGYLAVAHREAFVLQSTLAHPDRLLDGLTKMAGVPVPAAALVSAPAWTVPMPPWLQLAATHFGRGFPLFRYDPSAGETWAERFDLEENPEPEKAWTTPAVRFVDESGAEHDLDEPFTFAHAAALDPAYRPHFRVIPAEAWSDDQVPVAEWLAAESGERLRRVPFLWVLDDGGVLARAVLTREMAFSCLDHMRAWRILQELGGEGNEYARRAAAEARARVTAEAEEARAALEAEHAAALGEARTNAAAEALGRLADVLLSEDAVAALSGATPLVAPAPAAGSPVAVEPAAAPAPEAAPAAVEEEEEEAVSFNEPYIDSMLCTTCNECTNLNGRMFKYNENRQATVADPAAGTFEELVKAAEKCPARCIHPGVPRSHDSTATDDLIARAAKYN